MAYQNNNLFSTKIRVRVHPKAKTNGISEIMDDGTIKISLKAPPVNGKANRELLRFLSDVLGVKKNYIDIKAGFNDRNKIVEIFGLKKDIVINLLEKKLEK